MKVVLCGKNTNKQGWEFPTLIPIGEWGVGSFVCYVVDFVEKSVLAPLGPEGWELKDIIEGCLLMSQDRPAWLGAKSASKLVGSLFVFYVSSTTNKNETRLGALKQASS